MLIKASPVLREVSASKMENVQFKQRKIVKNMRLKEFTNPSGKQFKVNDPCGADPYVHTIMINSNPSINGWLDW